jgi:pyruvate dehydrogenase E1 component
VLASTVPNLLAYDPAYAYEIAAIVRDGLDRMVRRREDVLYYITLANENYPMPAKPEGAGEGILRGLYRLKPATATDGRPRAQLFGSGSLLREALRAQDLLAQRYGVAADVWSATSYKELRRDAMETERWNMLHPDAEPRRAYLETALAGAEGPIVAVSDYMRSVPDQIARWLPGRFFALGTDGFGRSDTREALRRFFEVDAESIAVATLHRLALAGAIDRGVVGRAIAELGIDPEKPFALYA